MGMYELMEGKEVNGRGVWQMAGGRDNFMYYGSTKTWFIYDRANMEAGKAAGYMMVVSSALTPDQVTETWKVTPDSVAWVDAPKVRARMYSPEEKRAAVEKLEQERQQAMAAARQVKSPQSTVNKHIYCCTNPPPRPVHRHSTRGAAAGRSPAQQDGHV